MATIRPFQGLRYGPSAGLLDDLVAPPYDVLSPEQRDAFAAKNPFNIVHLTLPEQHDDDRSKFVKYARSASRLEQWRQGGNLALDASPSYYRYIQTFTVPGLAKVFERTSLIATIKLEPYEKGVVLPHEQTFPKHKEDRLRILEATRSHLECIFGLFEDDDRSVLGQIQAAPADRVADVTTDDGVRHIVERVYDADATKTITGALEPKKVWIADGHHRYETALAFRAQLGEKPGEVAEDYMMMALASIGDPGLVLLPTHRILKTMPVDAAGLEAKLAEHFQVSRAANKDLVSEIERRAVNGARAFGVALPGGTGLVLVVADPATVAGRSGGKRLNELDVTILHEFIFARLLGLTGMDFFGYTRDADEAVAAVEQGFPASFLMNPPTVDDMRQIALGGEKMPQKSTYYYPKIISGLVLWSLNDFGS